MPSLTLRALTPAQRLLYEDTLRTSHEISSRVSIYDQNDQLLFVLQDRDNDNGGLSVQDGQIDVDVEKGTPRSLKLDILDPQKRLVFDPSALMNGMYINRMVGVDYYVRVPELSVDTEWVRVPVFMGPVYQFTRTGQFVSIEGLGKEVLFQPPYLTQMSTNTLLDFYRTRGGDPVSSLITLITAFGETKYRISVNVPTTAQGHWFASLSRNNLWSSIQRLARAVGGEAFYDAEGFLNIAPRRIAQTPIWTFTLDENSTVVSDPVIKYSAEGLYNTVQIYVGGTLWAEGRLRPEHPLSPESLARNGIPRVMAIQEQYDEMTTELAIELVEQRLNEIPLGIVEAQFQTTVIPHLEANDILEAQFDQITERFMLKQFSISLGPGGTMSIGYVKNVTEKVDPIITTTMAPGSTTGSGPAKPSDPKWYPGPGPYIKGPKPKGYGGGPPYK